MCFGRRRGRAFVVRTFSILIRCAQGFGEELVWLVERPKPSCKVWRSSDVVGWIAYKISAESNRVCDSDVTFLQPHNGINGIFSGVHWLEGS